MPYCTNCGYKIDGTETECPSCCAPLTPTSPAPTPTPAAVPVSSPVNSPISSASYDSPVSDMYAPPKGTYSEPNTGTYPAGGNTVSYAAPAATYSAATYSTAPAATYSPAPASNDKGSVGWWFLGFFFPVVGFILFLLWKSDRRGDARKAGFGALVGTIVSVVLSITITACTAYFMMQDEYNSDYPRRKDPGYVTPSGNSGSAGQGYSTGSSGQTSSPAHAYRLSDLVLIDNDVCKIVIENFENDTDNVLVNVSVTNKTNKLIRVQWAFMIINGYYVDTYFLELLGPRQTIEEQELIGRDELEMAGIGSVDEFTFTVEVTDEENYLDDPLANETFTLYPTGLKPSKIVVPDHVVADGELVLIDNDVLFYSIIDMGYDPSLGLVFHCYTENRTDKNIVVEWSSTTVGDLQARCNGEIDIPGGIRSFDRYHISNYFFGTTNIELPVDVSFNLSVVHEDSWDWEILYSEDFTVHVD